MDAERRKVARRTREFAETDAGRVNHGFWNRLADLIEPSYDRDALLELAEEMEGDAGCHAYVDDYVVNDYSRRIREALGE